MLFYRQTSNIFFHSTYNPEAVISTIGVKDYVLVNDILTVDCGVSVVKLAKGMLEQGYAGFHGLTILPGTVASAIVKYGKTKERNRCLQSTKSL